MQRTRLSSKGQITLPKSIRDSRAWQPGTEFIVEPAKNGVFLRPAALFAHADMKAVAGCLGSKRKAGSAGQTRRAVAKQVRRRHDRGRY